MPAYDKIIGRNIRNARKAKGLTQEAVADLLGVSAPYVGKLERGERSINLDKLAMLVPILDAPVEQMVLGCVDLPSAKKPDEDDFLTSVAEIVKGCSLETRKIMLDVLEVLAKHDKEDI